MQGRREQTLEERFQKKKEEEYSHPSYFEVRDGH